MSRVIPKIVPYLSVVALGSLLAGCGGSGSLASKNQTDGPRPGPSREFDLDTSESVFGEDGLTFGTDGGLGSLLGGEEEQRDGIPVNKFLWQASLDTLAFLPLASTDPFTGVIATDWGATPEAPGERFKVTAYLLNGELAATALRVAVFRQVLNEANVWVPAEVSPETPRQIEDAILTRARQIRIAELGAENTG